MELDSLIHSLYLIPIVLCLRTFQLSSKVYDRLPDKVPMHFNMQGQADQWWKKSRFSVYLMPFIGAATVLTMCGILLFIYRETGPLPDDFNLAYWFFTFSLTYLFYRAQIGIIDYALGKINTIWPKTGRAFVLLAVSSLFLVVVIIIPTKPKISQSIMCATVDNLTPVDERDVFSMSDGSATLFLKLRDIKGAHLIRMEWTNPEGNEHFVYEKHTPHKILAKHLVWWSYIDIKDNTENIIPGNWRVDVYIDREKVL